MDLWVDVVRYFTFLAHLFVIFLYPFDPYLEQASFSYQGQIYFHFIVY